MNAQQTQVLNAGAANSTSASVVPAAPGRSRARRLLAAALAVGLGLAVPAASFAGATGGARQNSTNVAAFRTDVYNIRFDGLEPAVVSIVGDGDTQLVARVYDENGNAIVADTDADGSGLILLRWTPRFDGVFTIRVTNRGNVYNHYVMRTN